MKQIQSYHAEKYDSDAYERVEDGIYFHTSDGVYVTSLSFVPEEEFGEYDEYGELAQYPLEDILEKFCCYIADFCEDVISSDPDAVCREFASNDLEDIRRLRTIIGKHVYNREDGEYVELVIEDGQVIQTQPEPQAEPKAEIEPRPQAESKTKGLLGFLKSLLKRK